MILVYDNILIVPTKIIENKYIIKVKCIVICLFTSVFVLIAHIYFFYNKSSFFFLFFIIYF